jgi:hypothetical protein
VVVKQVLKGHAMSNVRQKKSPLEIADLLLLHNAGASMEMIANVISEWGDLSDDKKFDGQVSIDIETAAPNGQRQSGNMNIERQGAHDG